MSLNNNFIKITSQIFILGIVFFIFSCGQTNNTKKPTASLDSSVTNIDKKEKERLEKRREIEEQNKIDSINLNEILKTAIVIAEQYKGIDKFKNEYVTMMPDSSYQVDVTISSDFYFTKNNPHLIIRRNTTNCICIDVFSLVNNNFQKVLSHEEWSMTYVNDTIQDINGDGLNDFVLNTYGATGCCLKAFSNIYILRSDKKTFSASFEFINPTFSPYEKAIRGICYGHPGNTEMYKYKWNGEKIDTIEYVSYEKNEKGENTGKIIISNCEPYTKNFRILKLLNNAPKEYRKIYGYDWFTGKGYD